MVDDDELLEETLCRVLSGIERELRPDLDWRAAPDGTGYVRRIAVYSAALVRDLIRIPLHHPDGIAQARFRVRIRYIERTAIPLIEFFVDRYPLSPTRRRALTAALDELHSCAGLVSDGKIPALDAWYATMDEFQRLTDGCRAAADALATAVGDARDVRSPDGIDAGSGA
jgi:hypothetical protein